MRTAPGIDFGTTNSAVAIAAPSLSVETAKFTEDGIAVDTFRSVLYFEQLREPGRSKIVAYAGPQAIERYLQAEQKGRLIQSIKSYLSSPLLTGTTIYEHTYTLEDLLGHLIRILVSQSELSLHDLGSQALVGRPVHFAGAATTEDEQLAMNRLRSGFSVAGIESVEFEFEPIAAAYFYESRLSTSELVLVGDFGGGTSDFSIVRLGRSRGSDQAERRILATEGIGIAGDAFDAQIIRHVVSPMLGRDTSYRSLGKTIEMPAWIYQRLERWHHLSFLKAKETMDLLRSLRATAVQPEQIDMLITLVSDDLGFYLHRAVQKTKFELSTRAASVFSFTAPGISVSRLVLRKEFESWIAEELRAIERCVDSLFERGDIERDQITRVFLTGGSSFVPAVRRIFEQRFGIDRLATGDEFTSVAQGLALRALERHPPFWEASTRVDPG